MKIIKLTKKIIGILKKQKEAFRKKLHREPKTNDPISFDSGCDYPTYITTKNFMDIIVEASTKAGIDSYKTLRLFQFTDEEIEKYFNSIRHKANT